MELASLVIGIAIVLALWIAMWRLGATAPRSRRRRPTNYTHADVGHHGHH